MNAEQERGDDVKFEAALEIAGYGKFTMYIIFLAGLTICCSFLSSLDVSFLMPAAQCDLQLTSEDKGFLSAAYFIGIISASHLSGFLADTMGRRYVLLRGLILNVFTYIFGFIAPNFWTFFILKIISGISTCPCMIATFPFLGEYVPEKSRAQTVMIATSLSTMGLLYSSLTGWLILQQEWRVETWLVTIAPWRVFYLLCGLPSVLCAFLYLMTPESPKFLLTRGKKGDTMKVLQRVYSINSGKIPQNFPVMSVSMDAGEIIPPARQKGVAGVLKNLIDQTLPLLRPPYIKNLLLCILLLFTILCSVNSIILWLPEVTNRIAIYKETNEGKFYMCQMLMREIVAVPNMTEEVMNTSAVVECDATINTAVFAPNLIISMTQPIVMLIASFVIPHVDRRLSISVILVVCSSTLFFINWVPDASLIVLMFGSVPVLIGICFNIITSILVELFPTYIRAMAVSLTMICGRLGSIFGSFLFSYLIDTRCSLLFQVISALILCCCLVPPFLKLKSRKKKQPVKEDVSSKNGTI